MKFKKINFKWKGFIYIFAGLAIFSIGGATVYFLKLKNASNNSHIDSNVSDDTIKDYEENSNKDKLDINEIFPENINISKYNKYLTYDYDSCSIKINESAKSSLLKHILTYLKVTPDNFGFLFEDASPQKFSLKIFVEKNQIHYFKIYVIELK